MVFGIVFLLTTFTIGVGSINLSWFVEAEVRFKHGWSTQDIAYPRTFRWYIGGHSYVLVAEQLIQLHCTLSGS